VGAVHVAQLLAKDYADFDARARVAIRTPDTWITVADDRGQVVNTLLPPGSPLPLVGSNDHRRGLTLGQVRVSNLFTGLVARQPSVGIDTLVKASDGSELYVSINMLAGSVSRILADQSLPPAWIGTILDRNGTVVARSRDAARFIGMPATTENVERVRAGVREVVAESVSLDGVPTVLAFSRSPGSGWSTIVAVPRTEITGAPWRSALYLAGVVGSCSLSVRPWPGSSRAASRRRWRDCLAWPGGSGVASRWRWRRPVWPRSTGLPTPSPRPRKSFGSVRPPCARATRACVPPTRPRRSGSSR
jgi:hypothetical protein